MNFAKPVAVVAKAAEPVRSLAPRRKWPISYRSVGGMAIASDIIIILLCGGFAGYLYNFEEFGIPDLIPQYLGSAAVVAAFYVSVMKGYGLYEPAELLTLRSQITSVASTWLGVFLFLAGAVFALKIGDHFSRGAIFLFIVSGLGLLSAERVFCRALLLRGLSGHKFSGRTAVLIADDASDSDPDLVPTLLKHGLQLEHQFTLPTDQLAFTDSEDFIYEVIAYLRGSAIDEVVVSVDVKRWGDLTKLFSALRVLPLPVLLIPQGTAAAILRRPSRPMGNALCIEVQREPLDTFERGVKRLIDILGALTGLVLLMPLLLITAVLIKFDSPGPILFRQRRCGFNGRPFEIYKFRTMTVLEDGPVVCQATKSDRRVTRLGKWLRRTSIDELPQLMNVLQGNMSLVGPRPHAAAHDDEFDKIVSNYAFRHHVKPGLTGWAQVNGHRGPTPTLSEIQSRVECDLWYIDNWSLRLDFRIIMRTILEVMRARNAY